MRERRSDRGPKARGTVTNRSGRFERFQIVPEDDGWTADDPEAPSPPTTLTRDATRTIISRNDSPDIPFDRSINPYRGCEHGCVYCYARPTHAYLGLSPGLDFETRLFFKPEAAALLRAELRRPAYRCQPMALGTNTDPYQPVEGRLRITRGILEVLRDHRHPVTIVTKSHQVVRDLDVLVPMARLGLARVSISITTMDRALARRLEPRAPTPQRRMQAIEALSRAGVPAGVMVAPVIPALTDHEMERILEACAKAGAGHAGFVLLRLPLELGELFTEWLERHHPLRARHVLAAVRETRDGRINVAEFGKRMRGSGPGAQLLSRRFDVACRRLGLARETRPLDTTLFHVPEDPTSEDPQGRLFDAEPRD
ncbi:MAG: PA0069 family radical SAM protein [Candidatus Polarisedimenticolia bacterium]